MNEPAAEEEHQTIPLIGAAGGEKLKDLLGKSKNPPETILCFQKDHGLHPLSNCSPALRLLDILHTSRSDIFRSCLEHLTRKLHQRIEESLSPEELQQLLLLTFPYIEFPELGKIPLAILAKQTSTPEIFLKKLVENREIMKQLPFHVKQRIWLVDAVELRHQLEQLIAKYIRQVSESNPKSNETLTYLTQMIGDDIKLYKRCISCFRDLFSTSPSHTMGSLRSDLLQSYRKFDPLVKLSTVLESCKVTGLITTEKLSEMIQQISSFCLKDKSSTHATRPVPSKDGLLDLISKFSNIDKNGFFADPVPEEVPGYYDLIKDPMDLSTMRHKVNKDGYQSVEAFQQDFNTMIENCLSYNDEKTIYYKDAKKLGKKGNDLIEKSIAKLLILPKNDTTTSAAVKEVLPIGKYRKEISDIAMLLADTNMFFVLMKTILKCVMECSAKRMLPNRHPMLKPLIQLCHIALSRTVETPNPMILQVFLPLLTRMNILYSRQYQSVINDVTQTAPIAEKCWKDLLQLKVVRKITQHYVVRSIRLGIVTIYKTLLELLAMHDDPEFLQSLVSAVLSHKAQLSMHMRTITIDEFLLPKVKASGENAVVHIQFARFLVSSADYGSISPMDIQFYVKDVVSMNADVKEYYQSLFTKYPAMATELQGGF